jgi:hypothetical protein
MAVGRLDGTFRAALVHFFIYASANRTSGCLRQ